MLGSTELLAAVDCHYSLHRINYLDLLESVLVLVKQNAGSPQTELVKIVKYSDIKAVEKAVPLHLKEIETAGGIELRRGSELNAFQCNVTQP